MAETPIRTWHRASYTLSTDIQDIPLHALNGLFASPDFGWAKPLPNNQLKRMLQGSVCFALYSPSNELVGFGRWITDATTVVYVTDVYIQEQHRGRGLARWMLECMDELLRTLPDLRGTIMIVDKGSTAEQLYRRHFAMEDLATPAILLDRKGPGSTTHDCHATDLDPIQSAIH